MLDNEDTSRAALCLGFAALSLKPLKSNYFGVLACTPRELQA